MELARGSGNDQPGSLTIAPTSAVFTIGCVAKLLGEDADWLYELSISMPPEDGCLHVYGTLARTESMRHRVPEADR